MLEKFSTKINTAAPIIGPTNVPRPPMMHITIGKKEVTTARCFGETKKL